MPTTARKSRLKCAWSNQPRDAARPARSPTPPASMVAAASCSRYRASTALGLRPTYVANSRCSDRTPSAPSAATCSTRTRVRSAAIRSTSASRSSYAGAGSGASGARAVSSTAARASSSSTASTESSSRPSSRPSARPSGAAVARPGSRPPKATQPPGRNLAAVTRPVPTRSMVKRRVVTPCTRTAGIVTPKRGSEPDSTDRFTLGWLSTSERCGGRPLRSQRTDQYRSTNGARAGDTRASRRRPASWAVSAGRSRPLAGPVAFVQDGTAAG